MTISNITQIILLLQKYNELVPRYCTSSNFLERRHTITIEMPIFTTQNENTMAKDRFDIKEKETMNLLTETMVIVDKETGVNYLYVGRGYGGGLTPLLDADGKPIITKDGYKK